MALILVTACQQTVEPKAEPAVELSAEPAGPHTSIEWRVWAYSTAAPSFIAANCSVMAMDGTILREGTNGWTAMAANPRGMSDPENGWKDAHEAMPMVWRWSSYAMGNGLHGWKNTKNGCRWMGMDVTRRYGRRQHKTSCI